MLIIDNFIQYNTPVAKAIGVNETLILFSLYAKFRYFSESGKLNDKGFFYCTSETIAENTAVSGRPQVAAIKKLVKLRLVEKTLTGIPCKSYFRFTSENLINVQALINAPEKSKKCKNSDIFFTQTAQTSLCKTQKLVSPNCEGNKKAEKNVDKKELFHNSIYTDLHFENLQNTNEIDLENLQDYVIDIDFSSIEKPEKEKIAEISENVKSKKRTKKEIAPKKEKLDMYLRFAYLDIAQIANLERYLLDKGTNENEIDVLDAANKAAFCAKFEAWVDKKADRAQEFQTINIENLYDSMLQWSEKNRLQNVGSRAKNLKGQNADWLMTAVNWYRKEPNNRAYNVVKTHTIAISGENDTKIQTKTLINAFGDRMEFAFSAHNRFNTDTYIAYKKVEWAQIYDDMLLYYMNLQAKDPNNSNILQVDWVLKGKQWYDNAKNKEKFHYNSGMSALDFGAALLKNAPTDEELLLHGLKFAVEKGNEPAVEKKAPKTFFELMQTK
jgi:hypothetical protein